MSGPVLPALFEFNHLILTTTLWDRNFHYLYFTGLKHRAMMLVYYIHLMEYGITVKRNKLDLNSPIMDIRNMILREWWILQSDRVKRPSSLMVKCSAPEPDWDEFSAPLLMSCVTLGKGPLCAPKKEDNNNSVGYAESLKGLRKCCSRHCVITQHVFTTIVTVYATCYLAYILGSSAQETVLFTDACTVSMNIHVNIYIYMQTGKILVSW